MKTLIQLDGDGYYSGAFEADESPMEPGVYLFPAGAVDAPLPPALNAGQFARWDGGAWEVVTDLRGTEYWLPDGSKHTIEALGDALPDDALDVAPAPALSGVKREAHVAMLDWIENLLSQFTAGVPAVEVASWSQKADAARSFLAGDAAPQVTDEAAITGEDPQDLSLAVVAKADLYTAIIARATGLRRATVLAIDAAETPEAVAAAIASAKASAEVMLADLGLAKREDV